jgi:hypothetical protein
MSRGLKALVIASLMMGAIWCLPLEAGVPVIWDGSAGIVGTHHAPPDFLRWEEGNWTKDGIPGQTAVDTMGDNTGGRGGLDIIIGGGAKVFHDQNDDTDDIAQGGTGLGLGDFQPRMDLNGPGSLTIKEGSTLWLDAHTDEDGRWARMNINLNLDNGIFRTTHTPEFCPPSECSVSGGLIIFGYQNQLLPNTILQSNLTNGGRIEMEGKMVWGNPDFHDGNASTGHNPGIGMNMTINNGTLDLTGGNLYDAFFGLVNGEMIFFYEWNEVDNVPKNESYTINFTGPGQIIVDNGLFVAEQDAAGVFNPKGNVAPDLYTSVTYQDLWNFGILQANGTSGLTPGASFNTYFTTSGSPGMPNYTLTSLVTAPGLDGDYNADGRVDAADYVVWRKTSGTAEGYNTWRSNFGRSSGAGAALGGVAAVPEPVGLTLILLGLAAIFLGRGHRCC